MRRIGLILAVVLAGSLAAVAVAIGSGTRSAVPAGPIKAAAALAYDPGPGATGVNPTAPIGVRVSGGSFADVTLRDAEGTTVEGALSDDRTRWTATQPLRYAQTYTWSGTATGENGNAVPLEGTFATVEPQKLVRGVVNIGDGRTVGVAAPIEIQFDTHVDDRAAVERALTVQTSTPVVGAWGWLPDENGGSRIHYRTKEYWPANTEVTVTAKLFGVDYGGGGFGKADLSSTFTIGRAQVVKADADSHRLVVLRNGKKTADYPASYGLAADPQRNTRSGVHVVTEKFTDKRMVSEQFGYDLVGEVGRADEQQRRVHPREPGHHRRTGLEQRHPRLHQPVDGQRQGLLRHGALRRPGGGHRHADQALRARRRHLGLDAVVGPVDGALSRVVGATV